MEGIGYTVVCPAGPKSPILRSKLHDLGKAFSASVMRMVIIFNLKFALRSEGDTFVSESSEPSLFPYIN